MTVELFPHQLTGVEAMAAKPYLWVADEPGAGKTLQVIRAAERLWREGVVDQVLVVCPAAVRGVWYDPEFGQLARYGEAPVVVEEYRSGKAGRWSSAGAGAGSSAGTGAGNAGGTQSRPLRWIVTNYELVRRPERLRELRRRCGAARTMLVLDESLAVKSATAAQTRACFELRQSCDRVVLLNGSPEGDSPGDAYSQCKIMDPEIVGCRNWYEFRARYAVMGGFARLQKAKQPDGSWKAERKPVQVVGWTNLDDLRRRMGPHVLRRTKREFIHDLPPVLPPETLTVPLSRANWDLYRQMRDDAVAWLDENSSASAPQAAVRVMRLCQMTAGFLGGVVGADPTSAPADPTTETVGSEKLDLLTTWLGGRLAEEPRFKVVVWCRFRAEAERVERAVRTEYPDVAVGLVQGVSSAAEREERAANLGLLDPRRAPAGPVVLVCNLRTGGVGVDLHAAHTAVYMSNDYSLILRRQSEGRLDRPGQVAPVQLFDVVATGPDGQRTADHAVVRALRKKEDVARWTAGEWSQVLKEA